MKMPDLSKTIFPSKILFLNPSLRGQNNSCAVYVDRDGTLIRHVDYLSSPDKMELLPGVKESVHALIDRGVHFFIFTNQSGVGRGYFPIETVYACQQRLFELLECAPYQISGWCIAPEAPNEKGGYRKPSPRYIEETANYFGFKKEDSHVIGDTMVDLETAWNSGANAWAVGNGKKDLVEAHKSGSITGGNYEFAESFPHCVDIILKKSQSDILCR